MAETTRITLELSADLSARLDRLAQLSDSSREALAAEALEEFVERELTLADKPTGEAADDEVGSYLTAEQLEREMPRILESIADCDAGRVYSHEDAMAMVDAVIAQAAAKRRSVWTTTATADLIEIFTYIAADNSRAAEGVRQRIHKVASGLAYFATGRRIAVDDVYQQIVPRLP